MPPSRDELISALLDKLQSNNEKLDEMKDSYYELKYMMQSHQTIDEKMHRDICNFIESVNSRLDTYNHQLEVHIAATELNKQEIREFKQTVKPLLDVHVEEQILKKANKNNLNKIKLILAIVGGVATAVATIIGILKAI